MLLRNYLEQLRRGLEKLEEYGFTESLEIKEEIRANKLAVFKASVVLYDGSSLHISEYIDAIYKIEKVSYAYHFQDNEGNCIFRYDNANHKPPLGFTDHKHTREGKIIEFPLPVISELIEEVIKVL